MRRTRAQIRAELVKKAQEEIDRLLDWEEQTEKPTLTQVENEILSTRKVLGEAMLEAALTGQEAREPVEAARCPQCGRAMEAKGRQMRVVETRVGTLRLEREYYYCADCEVGFFPPG